MRSRAPFALLLLLSLPVRAHADDPPAPPAPPAPPGAAAAEDPGAAEQAALRLAATYSRQHGGLSLLVQRGGRVLFEDYAPGFTAESAHRLASGTKSFWGVVATAAQDDGLLTLDELVSATIPEWKADPRKSMVTIRHLLTLTAGLEMATLPLQNPLTPDKYTLAAGLPAVAEPGTTFRYGPTPYYVFGEVLRRKLLEKNEDPLAYLKRRILDPIGLKPASWSRDGAGHPDLPHGAALTAREWAKFGELIRQKGSWEGKPIVKPESLAACFVGTAANPGYGLTFWLTAKGGKGPLGGPRESPLPDAPSDLVTAAGFGGQMLCVIPSQDTVLVVQAERDRGWSDTVFFELLTGRRTTFPGGNRPTPGPPATGEARLRGFLRSLDKDGDGRVSMDEAPPRIAERFEELDLDLDGYLTSDELARALQGVGAPGGG